jgi:hypothetical protein
MLDWLAWCAETPSCLWWPFGSADGWLGLLGAAWAIGFGVWGLRRR